MVTQKELDNSAKSANNEVRILNNLQHSIENTSKKFEEFKIINMTLMKAIINLVNPLMQLQNMQQKLQKNSRL